MKEVFIMLAVSKKVPSGLNKFLISLNQGTFVKVFVSKNMVSKTCYSLKIKNIRKYRTGKHAFLIYTYFLKLVSKIKMVDEPLYCTLNNSSKRLQCALT